MEENDGMQVLSLADVSMEEAAVVLADAFHLDGGSTPTEWRALLEREVEAKRVNASASRAIRFQGLLAGICLLNFGRAGQGRIGPTGVLSRMRRQGFGRRLVEESLRVFRAEQVSRVRLEVSQDNPSAQKLYESVGFQRTRALANVRLNRQQLDWPANRPPVREIPYSEALQHCERLHDRAAAFQRTVPYLASFEEGAVAYAIGPEPSVQGVLICRGRAVLDVAFASEDKTGLLALLLKATQAVREVRMIHEPTEGKVWETLQSIGAVVESNAWEMVWRAESSLR